VGLAVVTLSGTDPADTELQRFLADRLAPHKRPARIIRLEALPRATGGKLQRGALTERFRAEAEPAERRPPETESEQLLAHLWRSLLGLDKVAAGDHFFDRGGDSLKTAALVHQIERSTGKRLPPAALYEAPTLEGLAARLDAVEAEPPEPEESETPPGGLPADIRHGLEAYLAAWPGARQRADALLIGRHIEGERLPLFWCVNSREELDPLSDALGPDQPVYGMRTLCRVPGRKPQHNPPLAGLYADELEHLQPEGPIVLGGFCEGGRIALEMARLLRERGRDVARLILQDEFVPRPYDGPVSLYMCRPGSQIWARDFPRPERAWPRFYLGALHIEHLEATHRNCYESPAVEDFARRLRRETDNAHDESLPAPADATRGLLDSGVHAAELSARPPTVLRAGQCCTLRVRVRNIGTAPWAPTEESGLVVGARWLTQGKRRRGLAGHAILREVVKPGFSVVVDLPVQVPERSTTRYLDIDMVEDGVCWFQDRGSESLRKWVLILAPLSAGTEQER
jgi:thioesterase domain-containing protein/acyl carrier protein